MSLTVDSNGAEWGLAPHWSPCPLRLRRDLAVAVHQEPRESGPFADVLFEELEPLAEAGGRSPDVRLGRVGVEQHPRDVVPAHGPIDPQNEQGSILLAQGLADGREAIFDLGPKVTERLRPDAVGDVSELRYRHV